MVRCRRAPCSTESAESGAAAGMLVAPAGCPSAPAYQSRARVQGAAPSVDDDTWAIAATLYFALTGSAPWAGASPEEIGERIGAGPPAPLAVFDVGDDELAARARRRVLEGSDGADLDRGRAAARPRALAPGVGRRRASAARDQCRPVARAPAPLRRCRWPPTTRATPTAARPGGAANSARGRRRRGDAAASGAGDHGQGGGEHLRQAAGARRARAAPAPRPGSAPRSAGDGQAVARGGSPARSARPARARSSEAPRPIASRRDVPGTRRCRCAVRPAARACRSAGGHDAGRAGRRVSVADGALRRRSMLVDGAGRRRRRGRAHHHAHVAAQPGHAHPPRRSGAGRCAGAERSAGAARRKRTSSPTSRSSTTRTATRRSPDDDARHAPDPRCGEAGWGASAHPAAPMHGANAPPGWGPYGAPQPAPPFSGYGPAQGGYPPPPGAFPAPGFPQSGFALPPAGQPMASARRPWAAARGSARSPTARACFRCRPECRRRASRRQRSHQHRARHRGGAARAHRRRRCHLPLLAQPRTDPVRHRRARAAARLAGGSALLVELQLRA